MTVRISRAAWDAMLSLAAGDPDHEVCGLLFGDAGRIVGMVPTANVAATPRDRFEIDPVALIAAFRSERGGGPAIVGYFHSHPRELAVPSSTDRELAAFDGRLWVISGLDGLAVWRATAGGFVFEPLERAD